jgi:hypothetical protein
MQLGNVSVGWLIDGSLFRSIGQSFSVFASVLVIQLDSSKSMCQFVNWLVIGSSLNVLTMALYYYFLNFGLCPSSPCFKTTTFRGMVLPSSSGAPTLMGPVDGASLDRGATDRGERQSYTQK